MPHFCPSQGANWCVPSVLRLCYQGFAALTIVALLGSHPLQAQNVSIGTATANSSALLHLESTTQGLLAPRMSNTQMLAIASPATGDLVYNTTYVNYYYYTGSYWTPLGGSGWSLTGDAGTSASTNFLGTKDSVDLVQKTKTIEHLRFYAAGNVGLTNSQNTAEQLAFYEPSGSGTNYTSFKAGIQSGTVHYILPLADGLPNQALVTDGAGNLSWHTFSTFGGSGTQSLWKRGSAAGGEYSDSSSNSDSGPYSIAAGKSNSVTGNYEDVFGSSNSIQGSYGSIHGGVSNGSSGDYDVVGGGQSNSAQATATFIGGGSNNSPQGDKSVIIGGTGNSINATNGTILGGSANSIGGNNEMCYGQSVAMGTSAFVVFKMGTHRTLMGVGTTAPTEYLDVVGNVKFSGSLKPNNSAGTSGQYLKSAGSGTPPTWGTISLPSTNWALTGTFGSTPPSSFIGTIDAQDFVTRTNATERMRVTSGGLIGINTSSPAHQLTSHYSGTATEVAALYGNASGSTTVQAVGIWGRADNTSIANTGTISLLGVGNGNTTAGQTNVALQINDGEFAMGRTTEAPSVGTDVEGATAGTLFSAHGPSGVIQL